MIASGKQIDLESRVAGLERQVQGLVSLLATGAKSERKSDWQKAVGYLGDDPVMKRILKEAENYRAQSREPVRKRRAKASRANKP